MDAAAGGSSGGDGGSKVTGRTTTTTTSTSSSKDGAQRQQGVDGDRGNQHHGRGDGHGDDSKKQKKDDVRMVVILGIPMSVPEPGAGTVAHGSASVRTNTCELAHTRETQSLQTNQIPSSHYLPCRPNLAWLGST